MSSDGKESLPAAVADDVTVLPLTTAVSTQGQLSKEPVVEWLIRWDSPAYIQDYLLRSQYHLTELRE